MIHRLHLFPDLILLFATYTVQLILSVWVWRRPERSTPLWRSTIILTNLFFAALFAMAYLLGFHRVTRRVPMWWATWIEAVGLIADVALIALFVGMFVWRQSSSFQP